VGERKRGRRFGGGGVVDPAGSGRRADGSGRGRAEGGTEGPVAASARPPPTDGGGGRVEVGSRTPRDRGRRPRGIGASCGRKRARREEGGTEGPVAASARPPPTEGGGGGRVEVGSRTPRDRGRRADGSGRGGRDRGARRGLGEATSNGGRGRRSGGGGVADPAGSGRRPRGIGASCGRKRARREGGGTEGPVAASARPPPTEGGGGGRVEVGSRTPRDRVVDPAGSGASCGRKRARREGGGTEGPVAARRGHLQRRRARRRGTAQGRREQCSKKPTLSRAARRARSVESSMARRGRRTGPQSTPISFMIALPAANPP
jgi:hypothetical protein